RAGSGPWLPRVMDQPVPPGASRAVAEESSAGLDARTPHRGGHDFRRVSVHRPMAEVNQRNADSSVFAVDGPGRPLEAQTRADLEPHFGVSFERVRVHEGPAADRSARAIHARAYTIGNDVVFAD